MLLSLALVLISYLKELILDNPNSDLKNIFQKRIKKRVGSRE